MVERPVTARSDVTDADTRGRRSSSRLQLAASKRSNAVDARWRVFTASTRRSDGYERFDAVNLSRGVHVQSHKHDDAVVTHGRECVPNYRRSKRTTINTANTRWSDGHERFDAINLSREVHVQSHKTRWRRCYSRSRMRSELQTLKTNDDKVRSRPKSQNDRPCDESQNARHTLSMSNRCWTESVFTLQHPNTNNDGWEWLLTPPWCCGRGNVNAGVWLVATQSSAAEESDSVGHFPYCGQIKLNWRQLWLIMSKHSWNFKFE